MAQSQVHNTDCIKFMQSLPDNFFSLAIADPPYGDAGQNNANPHVDLGSRTRKYLKDIEITPPHTSTSWTRFGGMFERYTNRRDMGSEVRKKILAWDTAPDEEFFKQLFRVSRGQIIWGGQLLLPASYTLFCSVAQTLHFRRLLDGHVRIRMDFL